MKGKQPQKKNIELRLNRSAVNRSLNFILLILTIVILYMSFTLVTRLHSNVRENFDIKKKPVSSSIQVEVLNGCGVSGIADTLTDFLRNHHFDVVQIGNYISYDVEKSIVIDRTGNMINALKVADSLGISRKNVIQQMNNNYLLDVSLIVGKDFNTLKPFQ